MCPTVVGVVDMVAFGHMVEVVVVVVPGMTPHRVKGSGE